MYLIEMDCNTTYIYHCIFKMLLYIIIKDIMGMSFTEVTSMSMFCNKCRRELNDNMGAGREDYLHVIKDWGYFSERDLETHEFILCEKCYNEIINSFLIPVKVKDRNEAV